MAIRPQSLTLVIDLALRRRDEAGARLAAAMAQLAQAQLQLRQLTDYTAEGEAKWQARSVQGVSGVLLAHHRAFEQKLQEAIAFQHTVIEQHQQNVAQQREGLQAAERELSTLKKVRERAEQAAAERAHRQQQKQVDEMAMAMQAFHRRQAEQEIAP